MSHVFIIHNFILVCEYMATLNIVVKFGPHLIIKLGKQMTAIMDIAFPLSELVGEHTFKYGDRNYLKTHDPMTLELMLIEAIHLQFFKIKYLPTAYYY